MAYIFDGRNRRVPIREMQPVVNSRGTLSTPFENVTPNVGMIGMRSFGGGPATGGLDPRQIGGGPDIPGLSRPMSVGGDVDRYGAGGQMIGMANPMGGGFSYNPNEPGVSTPGSPLRRIGGFNPSSTNPGGGVPWSLGQGASTVPERSFRGTSGQTLSPFANVMYQAPFSRGT